MFNFFFYNQQGNLNCREHVLLRDRSAEQFNSKTSEVREKMESDDVRAEGHAWHRVHVSLSIEIYLPFLLYST